MRSLPAVIAGALVVGVMLGTAGWANASSASSFDNPTCSVGSDETTLSCTDEGIFEGDGFPTEAAAKDEAKNDLKLWIIRQRRVCEPEQNWILQAGKEAGVTGWVGIATAHGCHG